MSYGEKVLERLSFPGLALMVIGAALVYTSSLTSKKLFPKTQEIANVIIKAVGCVIALVGTLILLDFIG